jgi:glycerophosphoryl diester phosphodiesterase
MKEKIILHRGYKGKYLENSKISFEMALKENKNFETDIRISKDGVCYMIHDNILDNLFNGSGKINDFLSEELKEFHYKEDSLQKLCSLKEMCELVNENPGKSLIFIHIKELKDIKKIISVLEQYNFKDRLRFFAVDEIVDDFKEVMRKQYPSYKIGLYLPENSDHYNEIEFKDYDFIWADEITIEWINKEKIDLAHSLGKPFYAISPELISESIFNSNVKKRWEELLKLNIDGICTDFPNEFLR